MDKKRIKIFVISPNDVKTERFIVKDVCEALNESAGGKIEIVPLIWEDRPLSYPKTPQESVDPLLEEADIYVVILWYRLGTPVEGCRGAITGEENVTGTQYEIEKILSMGKERIFFYLKTEKLSVDVGELKEAVRQKEMLESFIEKMGIGKTPVRHGYQEFRTVEAFKALITTHLKAAIEEMTGEKIATDKTEYRRSVIAYVALFAMFVGMALAGYRLFFPERQTHTVNYREQPTPTVSKREQQRQKAIYVSATDAGEPIVSDNRTPHPKFRNRSEQKIGYLLIAAKEVQTLEREIVVTIEMTSIRRDVGAAMAVYAEGSDNIADFWKFFLKPKIAKLTDSDGNSYRFKSTTLKYGKTSEDWTKIRPGERHIEQFVFVKEKEDEPVGELTFSFLVYLAMLDNKGKARVSNATLYLERLTAN